MAEKVELPAFTIDARRRLSLHYLWGVAATAMSVLLTLLLALPAFALATSRRYKALAQLARFWARGIVKFCGVRVELSGFENLTNLTPCLLVSNHQSFFDVFTMLAFMPINTRFVAKKELLKFPAFGYALQHSDNVVIDREAGGRTIRHAIHVLRSGLNLGIFPEGHRFTDGRVHEFEDGTAWLAILSQKPAVPMAIGGSGLILPPSAAVVSPGRILRIAIGTPIPTAGMRKDDRAELTSRLHEEVSKLYQSVSAGL
ncbi:MAG TPA: lysophospholipid acyltransferase family protein [Candidatus Binataceae bacterium]|nr:lysophospholipid acyltransferase family protein [Candidatus Binataceae bacterium]